MRPTTEITRLIEAIEARQAEANGPLLVGLDGRSGVGKSTLATAVAKLLRSAAVIKGDEFYTGGSQDEWDSSSAEAKASLVIDWKRQLQVLDTLRRGTPARWYGYDWDAFDGRLDAEVMITPAADVVLLEGAYSCRPELASHLDLTVLIELDHDLRLARLLERDGQTYRDDWLARWTEAEDHYFSVVRPPSTFDLVLTTPPVLRH